MQNHAVKIGRQRLEARRAELDRVLGLQQRHGSPALVPDALQEDGHSLALSGQNDGVRGTQVPLHSLGQDP